MSSLKASQRSLENWDLIAGVDFAFSDIEKAYSTFQAAAEHKALKVLINM